MNPLYKRGLIIVALVLVTFAVVFKTSSKHPLVLTSTGLFDPRLQHNEDNETHPENTPAISKQTSTVVATTESVTTGPTTEAPVLYTTNPPTTGWRVRLYTPTHIVHYNGMWIIVDCWHHRLIYNIDLLAPISQWASVFEKSAPGKIIVPHSVATDGEILVTESSVGGSDGDDHTLEVFLNKGGSLVPTQTLLACPGNKARRPHRVIYDATTSAFYLYLTNPPHLARFVRNGTGALVNDYCEPVPSMGGQYARSIVIKGTSMLITAGPKVITELQLSPTGAFKFLRSYSSKAIGISAGKMNDLAFIDGWWYATSTRRCGLGRFRELAHPRRTYQDLTPTLLLCTKVADKAGRCTGGTPYYVTSFEGRIFVPYIFGCSGMVSFVDSNETIADVRQHWGGGWMETAEDMRVRGTKW